MLSIFGRFKNPKFNIPAIGDHWLVRPLTHDGVPGTLHVRQIPSDVPRKRFPIVALSWIDKADISEDMSSLFRSVKDALEQQGHCLLVLIHDTPDRVNWYAYAADSKVLDKAFASLNNAAIRWGVNEDQGWLEYEHAKGLVGA